MTRGRKKIPDVLKKQRGTLRKCRVTEKVAVVPVSKMPPAPKYFNSHSRKCWRKLGLLLIDLGLINPTNIISFELLCSEYGIYKEAQENMGTLSEMIDEGVDKYGNRITKITAFRKISERAFENFRKQATEFGLSPATITRIAARRPEDKDPMSEFE